MTEKKEEGQKKEYTKEQQMIDQERANVRRVKRSRLRNCRKSWQKLLRKRTSCSAGFSG